MLKRMKNENIMVTRSSMPPMEEYINEIKELWDSRWITNLGKKHNELEGKLEEYLQVPYVRLITNGHLSLEVSLSVMELEGEVITTPFTFVSTANAICRRGLTPVFCDIREDDYTMDADKIEALITPKTSAILPVHVYGHVCDYERIENIAKKYGLKVIYDAAHAFGIKMNGMGVGSLGDISCFSFHATKVFNTVEGGAVVYSDESLTDKIMHIRNFGFTGENTVNYIGGNSKMDEFRAAMGLCNLRHIEDNLSARKKVYERYIHHLDGHEEFEIWKVPDEMEYNYSYFPIRFKEGRAVRDRVYEGLKEAGIYTRKYFYPLITDFECYCGRFDSEKTKIAKKVADEILTLPLYPDLEIEIVDEICQKIKEV